MVANNQNYEQSVSPDRIKLIANMFEDWKRVYQNRFKPEHYDLRTAELWATTLKFMGMNLKQFQTAMQKSLIPQLVGQNGFPPSSVEDFYNLAFSDEFMSAEQAFQIACSESGKMPEVRNWSDTLIYESARRCGISTLINCQKGYFRVFLKVYEQVIAEYRAGAKFQLPSRKRQLTVKPASQEFVDNLLKKHGWYKEKIR